MKISATRSPRGAPAIAVIAATTSSARLTDYLPLGHFHRRRKDITRAAHRLDHHRSLRVVFQLAPQPSDLDVDCPVERPGLAIARKVQKPIPGQHLIGVVDKGREQIELSGGKSDLLARRRVEFAAR